MSALKLAKKQVYSVGYLAVLAVIEAVALMVIGVEVAPAITSIAGPVIGVIHDLTFLVSVPLNPVLSALVFLFFSAIRIHVIHSLTLWSYQRVLKIYCVLLVACFPVAISVLAFGLTGVPYLWLAGFVFGGVLTASLGDTVGQKSWLHSLMPPAVASLFGFLATLLPDIFSFAVSVVGIICVAVATVYSMEVEANTKGTLRSLLKIVAALMVVLVGTGVLYVVLRPSERAPDDIRKVLKERLANTSQSRIILVDGFNTSRRSPPWIGVEKPVTWFSYAGFDDDGNPLPYTSRDTLTGIYANVDNLAEQIKRESSHGKVSLVGISQGSWIIMSALDQNPELDSLVDKILLIDLPVSQQWINPTHPFTYSGLWVITKLVALATPVDVSPKAPLAKELTEGSLPDLSHSKGDIIWLRSVMDAATPSPKLSVGTKVIYYWGAHALTIGLPTGRSAIDRVFNGDNSSQKGARTAAFMFQHFVIPWSLPVEGPRI